ncbi:hypothetical protein NDU88_005558 [Pleurodeles waltl]|uniref:Uncharacterized protein n=1 Tax=Pleurodeles waltl TaxID=8319 RepID=A0AAV7MDA4_PLEWA|nr:hypothetical protein NDU88_005558 [Pleurodeles waltl]
MAASGEPSDRGGRWARPPPVLHAMVSPRRGNRFTGEGPCPRSGGAPLAPLGLRRLTRTRSGRVQRPLSLPPPAEDEGGTAVVAGHLRP